MAAKSKGTTDSNEITILEVTEDTLNVCVLGTSPFIANALSEKAKHELLMPAPRKNAAEKAANLKHIPLEEYRNSVYTARSVDAPTRIEFRADAFKKALASAALDIPGAAKAQIGRLVWVCGDRVSMFGVPQILCSIVRSADMNKTPDVRTRAILPEWACRLSLRYMTPILKRQTVANLLAVAGLTQGVGDWRQQKGSGSYGQFKLVSEDNPDFVRIMAEGGAEAQTAALLEPDYYDDETAKLLSWFDVELKRRGAGGESAARPNGRAKKADAPPIVVEA